ncbi:prenyltransferase/squalene oxidase repeat-containing protein [Urbifossiella limnaea]|uniref:Prenyltransferase and squalene oxidase repeat protein n=1 Tax=Urbifossiella limnaea TaxID=2528023 RepID=A0A517XVC1_9BACT|nr:prenyltransferase/squalene oxidase repeat-containing protein [Urbifossiella limnaea]QDU21460.1 Prenyltransferase and squalene oxidase repeat protein [Urbifossiella limnaea]
MFAALALTLFPLPPAPAHVGAAKALPLLAKAATGHADQKTCFACHNQAPPLMAHRAAVGRGFASADALFKAQAEHAVGFITANRERFVKGQGTGGGVDTAGSLLFALEQAGHKADENTAAVVEYLLQAQADRDHWRTGSNRPPTEASSFATTALAVRALKKWATPEQRERADKRVAAARSWLIKTHPADTEDRVFRLFGLKAAGAGESDTAAAAWELLKAQQPDGGWRQLDTMTSDAYATGTALVALKEAGGLAANHPAYSRGVEYLLRTQLPDGSWHVRSRSKPFQPYYESGFPHEKDQFVSVAATGWATTALVFTAPPR